jgi:hypothetical protein
MDQTPKPPTDDSSVFFTGSPGLVSMAVCAPAGMTREEIVAQVNVKSPTGLVGGWIVTDEGDLPDDIDLTAGYPRPCPDGGGRLHYVMNC